MRKALKNKEIQSLPMEGRRRELIAMVMHGWEIVGGAFGIKRFI